MGQLDNKVCLVTGASKGIGRAIAEVFAAEGAVVIANARKQGSIDDWARSCSEENGVQVLPMYFDVTDHQAVKDAVKRIKSEYQRLDVLVNNAGVVSYELLPMLNIDKFREMLEVNVIGAVHLTQLASRLMSRQKSGSIINISSVVAVNGVEGQAAYAASKGALISFTKAAAKELASGHVRVNAVAPGMIGTERIQQVFEKNMEEKESLIGMKRLGEPEEIADACVFLASDKSRYITGQTLVVDGSTRF